MTEVAPGFYTGQAPVDGIGGYRLSHGDISTVAAVGMLNPIEFAELLPTLDKVQPLTDATDGHLSSLGLDGSNIPAVRRVRNGDLSGQNWLGVRDNNAFTVTRSQRQPLAPPLVFFIAFFLALAWGWLREAK